MTSIIVSTIIEVLIASAIIVALVHERKIIAFEDRLFANIKSKVVKTHSPSILEQKYNEQKAKQYALTREYDLLLRDYDKPHLTVLEGRKSASVVTSEVA